MEEPLRINTDISSASEGQRSQLPELPDDVCLFFHYTGLIAISNSPFYNTNTNQGLCQEDIEDLDEELGSGVSGKVRKCKYLKV